MEGRGLAFVIDGIFGVIDALGQGLIAHIDGVASCLGKIGLIGGFGEALAALAGLHLAGGSCLEGILQVGIGATVEGEAGLARKFPRLLGGDLEIAAGSLVVIDNHLVALPVALAGRKNVGAGFFQHRDEIGDDEGLGV